MPWEASRIINSILKSGTGMHLVQSTWQAIEQETENDNRLVVIVYIKQTQVGSRGHHYFLHADTRQS